MPYLIDKGIVCYINTKYGIVNREVIKAACRINDSKSRLNAFFLKLCNLCNEKYARDPRPIDENCNCPACRHHSRSYIRHVIKAKEALGMMLAVSHNLYFYNELMRKIREALDGGYFYEFYQKYHNLLAERNPD